MISKSGDQVAFCNMVDILITTILFLIFHSFFKKQVFKPVLVRNNIFFGPFKIISATEWNVHICTQNLPDYMERAADKAARICAALLWKT